MRERLNALVLSGTKQATCGLRHHDYEREGEAIEHVGERLVLLGDDGDIQGLIEVVEVRECTFGEVTWEMASREGEGDHDLTEWREGHQRFWLRAENLVVTDDTPVVWFAFRVIPAAGPAS